MEIHEADELANRLHAGQRDKAGKPYIDHPRFVASRAAWAGMSKNVIILALLHDVVEDCDVSIEDLREEGVPEEVLIGLRAISRDADEKYADYIRRCDRSPMAKQVKILDLKHNLSPERQAEIPAHEARSLAKRYNRSLAFLIDGWEVL